MGDKNGPRRSEAVDLTIATLRDPATLIARRPSGHGVHRWVYVRRFGEAQWSIFFAFLAALALVKYAVEIMGGEHSLLLTACTAYLFMIQRGSHSHGGTLAAREVGIQVAPGSLTQNILKKELL